MATPAKIVVGEGTENWLRLIVGKMRSFTADPGALVVVFRDPAGPIGFDLNSTSETLFRAIIGEGFSASPEDGSVVHYEAGEATGYVRSLFVRGLALPITVASSPILSTPRDRRSPPSGATIASIHALSKMDIDDDAEVLSEGIAKIAADCNRVCIHGVAQWVTNIVSATRGVTLQGLEAAAGAAGVDFQYVPDERLLPQW
jgi:hypothetical protein